jgi:hypothetical protein
MRLDLFGNCRSHSNSSSTLSVAVAFQMWIILFREVLKSFALLFKIKRNSRLALRYLMTWIYIVPSG